MKNRLHVLWSLAMGVLLSMSATTFAQTTYTFTTAGAVDDLGPTQAMTDAAYTGTNLAGKVRNVGGIQYWEVPSTGLYKIETFGGQGYGSFGGRGAHITGEFLLNGGDTLKILVGQRGGNYLNFPATTYNHQFGGGGGSFVTSQTNTPLCIAGGGGGNHSTAFVTTCDGQAGTAGAAGSNGSTVGAGGTNGGGGTQASSADAGAGLTGNGDGTAGGTAFINGGQGGKDEGTGGFGGGGGTSSWNNYRGGGGGGYSGGGGGNNGSTCCPAGGGGGSFNAGTNQVNIAGVNLGDGQVIITELTKATNDGGISEIIGFDAAPCPGISPVEVVVRNYGGNQLTSIIVQWSVEGVSRPDSALSTLIDTSGGNFPDSIRLTLGSVQVDSAITLRVWTSMPNGVADTANFNDTMVVNIKAPVAVSAQVGFNVLCNGFSNGAAMATVTGGRRPYSLLWSDAGNTTSSNLSGVPAGTYKIVVTDASSCKDSTEVTITEPPAIQTSATTTPVISGNDGAIDLSVTGGVTPYTFDWSNAETTEDISGLAAGMYTVIVKDDNNCLDTLQVTVGSAVGIDEITEALGINVYPNPSTTGKFQLKTNGFVGEKTVQVLNLTGKTVMEFSFDKNKTDIDLSDQTTGIYLIKVTDGVTEALQRVIIK